ncbi:MAG TPA: hypothetical protein VKU00_16420 [Chthonomonadaceae bacterium]|nr:hypothetical protein [Chthonomonadaceae bacterium]
MKRVFPILVVGALLIGVIGTLPARADKACDVALATIAKANTTLSQLQELGAAIRKRQQDLIAAAPSTPGTPAKAGAFVTLDLQPKANQALSDDLHDEQGNNFKNLPQGEQTLAGVAFKIGPKMVHMRGAHAPNSPDKVEGLPVQGSVSRLHLLHGTGYNLDAATEIGAYIVHYADGTTERIPIVYGEDVRDWWNEPTPDLKRARLGWTGTNPAAAGNQSSIHLYILDWTNPHPDKPISSLDFTSSNTECDPFLVALSLERP